VENKGSRMTEVIKEASLNLVSKQRMLEIRLLESKSQENTLKTTVKEFFFMQDHENMILKHSPDFLTYSGFFSLPKFFLKYNLTKSI